jgi:hypothetical protein
MARGNFNNHPLGPRKQFCKRGHDTFVCGRVDSHCRDCEKERQKIVRKKNEEAIAEWHRIWYIDNKEKIRKQHEKYRKTHAIEIKQHRDKLKKEHPEKEKLRSLRRAKKRSLRIPKFGQRGIKTFYKNCPKGMHVDHIVPLCGKLVSGLHVIWNLQYLTKVDNDRKHIQFDGTLENNGWKVKRGKIKKELNAAGWTQPEKKVIRIDSVGLDDAQSYNVFLHELIHAAGIVGHNKEFFEAYGRLIESRLGCAISLKKIQSGKYI